MIAELLLRFEPEGEGLLREISRHIDDHMLTSIASADYGRDVDQHLAALRQIRDTGTFPPKMYWFPAEVLELFRWSDSGCGDLARGETDEFVHWARAFCCVALLRATRDPWNYGDGLSTGETTIRLILSLRALKADFITLSVRFFAWLLLPSEREWPDDSQDCAYGIALLWFALQRTPPVDDETLISLAKWVIQLAREAYSDLIFGGSSVPIRMGVGNPPPSHWDALGPALFDLELSTRATELQDLIKLIGLELAG